MALESVSEIFFALPSNARFNLSAESPFALMPHLSMFSLNVSFEARAEARLTLTALYIAGPTFIETALDAVTSEAEASATMLQPVSASTFTLET